MSVLSKQQIIDKIRTFGGEDPDEAILELLEDVEDSWGIDTMYNKEKFEELEAKWRKRYADRFQKGAAEKEEEETEEEEAEKTKFEELFKEGK